MGYNSAYDLVTNIPEVVRVIQLNGGQTLLMAVPDKNCEHIAKMVGNQRFNRDGFNYRNGEVLSSVGRDELKKIEKLVDKSNRTVPDFMKEQIQQLLDLDIVEGGEGIDMDKFREIYAEEIGYPLEFHSYGFHSMEDFVHHGLAGMVDLKLEGFRWKVVAVGCGLTVSDPVIQTIGQDIKENVKSLMEENPFGMSAMTLVRLYEESFGRLELRQSRCSGVFELCRDIPDVCTLKLGQNREYTISKARTEEKPIKMSGVPSHVRDNIVRVLLKCGGRVKLQNLFREYLETVGESLNPGRLGFKNLKCLLKTLGNAVKMDVSEEVVTLTAGILKSSSPPSITSTSDLQTGWVNIVNVVSPEVVCLRTDAMTTQLWGLEEKMEQFYTKQKM